MEGKFMDILKTERERERERKKGVKFSLMMFKRYYYLFLFVVFPVLRVPPYPDPSRLMIV